MTINDATGDFAYNIEPNPRNAYIIQSLKPGDFVEVRFNANLNTAFYGFVVNTDAHQLRLMAHASHGFVDIDSEDPKSCLAYDLVIPKTSIAWIRHLVGRLKRCRCCEGLT